MLKMRGASRTCDTIGSLEELSIPYCKLQDCKLRHSQLASF
jgi:hypothetical protein